MFNRDWNIEISRFGDFHCTWNLPPIVGDYPILTKKQIRKQAFKFIRNLKTNKILLYCYPEFNVNIESDKRMWIHIVKDDKKSSMYKEMITDWEKDCTYLINRIKSEPTIDCLLLIILIGNKELIKQYLTFENLVKYFTRYDRGIIIEGLILLNMKMREYSPMYDINIGKGIIYGLLI